MSGRVVADEDEVRLAKALVNPDKVVRDRTVKALQVYIKSLNAKEFLELDMLKLWKALFYCFWYSDKVQIQDELADSLSKFIHKFVDTKLAIMFFQMFFRTMLREWLHLDQYRINKFYNLIRFVIREAFRYLQKCHKWSKKQLGSMLQCLEEEALQKSPNGVRFHIAEVYLNELHLATEGEISTKTFEHCLQPFLTILRHCKDNVFVDRVLEKVFRKCLEAYSERNFFTRDLIEEVKLKELIFEVAAEESTREPNRRKIYEVHREFQKTARITRNKRQLELVQEDDEEIVQKDTEVQLKKKGKSQKIAPAEDEEILQGLANDRKGRIKEKKSAELDKETKKSAGAPVDFISSKKYTGRKEGMVFKTGKKGLGYYIDNVPTGLIQKHKEANVKGKQKIGVRFGKNQSKDYVDSIKSLKASTPPTNVSSKKTRSALKKS